MDIPDNESILILIRREKQNKELSYANAVIRDKGTTPIMILTMIVDKIYLTRLLLLRKKYDIFAYFSALYIIYHLLILTFATMFF